MTLLVSTFLRFLNHTLSSDSLVSTKMIFKNEGALVNRWKGNLLDCLSVVIDSRVPAAVVLLNVGVIVVHLGVIGQRPQSRSVQSQNKKRKMNEMSQTEKDVIDFVFN